MKSIERAFFCALLIVGLSACDRPDPTIIRFGLATAPVTLDPRFITDATSYRIARLVYQSLVDFDSTHQAVPALATWEALSPTHYRFELRVGASFHNGDAVEAADVVATYRSILDPEVASPHRGALTNVTGINEIDPNTVDFTLENPDPLFPGLLVIGILPEEVLNDFPKIPVGSGPFRVITPPGDRGVMLRRDSDQQTFEFTVIRDATVRALKLVHAEVDVIQGSMAPELISWLEARDAIRVLRHPGTTFTYLGFNLDDTAVGVASVRLAIAHAIDRVRLTKYLFGDRARLAHGLFTPDHWAGHPNLGGIEFNPERARLLLGELGYSVDNPLPLEYKTSSDYFRIRIATAIQHQLKQVGIDLKILSYDWGTFYADVKSGRFQMYSLSWVGLKQPDIFRYAFHSESVPPAGANRGRLADSDIDRLIETAEESTDLNSKATHYRDIQQRLLVALPYVPMWYEDNVALVRTDIDGYAIGLDGYYDSLATVTRGRDSTTPRSGNE